MKAKVDENRLKLPDELQKFIEQSESKSGLTADAEKEI